MQSTTKTQAASKSAEQLLTLSDVLERLNLHRTTFWRMRKLGEFPAPFKIGAKLLWPESDVINFLAQCEADRNKATIQRAA